MKLLLILGLTFVTCSVNARQIQAHLLGGGPTPSRAFSQGVLSVKDNALIARKVDFDRVSKFIIPFNELSPVGAVSIESKALDYSYSSAVEATYANVENKTLYFWKDGNSAGTGTVAAITPQGGHDLLTTKNFRSRIAYADSAVAYLFNSNALTKIDIKTGKSKVKKFQQYPNPDERTWFFDSKSGLMAINGNDNPGYGSSYNVVRIWDFNTGKEAKTSILGNGFEGNSGVTIRNSEVIAANFSDYYLTLRTFTKAGAEVQNRFKNANETFIADNQTNGGTHSGLIALKYLEKIDLIAIVVRKTFYLVDPAAGEVVFKAQVPKQSGISGYPYGIYFDPDANVVALQADGTGGSYPGYFTIFKIKE